MNRLRMALCLWSGLTQCAVAMAQTVPQPSQTKGPWAVYVTEASRRFGIPEDWIERVMKAETGGRTHLNGRPIRSKVGAMGLMQLMPGTWAEMQSAHGLGADPDDPRDNILAGTAYLRAMFDRFGYPGMFGAYNAGPARYAASLNGVPLPGETRAYLTKVTRTEVETQPEKLSVTPIDRGLFAIKRSAKSESDVVPDAMPSSE
jgi:soluble lytic murein transglycosylase-like protein